MLLRGAALAAFLLTPLSCGKPAFQLRNDRDSDGTNRRRYLDILPGEDISVDRPSARFRNELQIGTTFVQNVEMDQTTTMHIDGLGDMTQRLVVDVETELAVSEAPEPNLGAREIDATYTRLFLHMEANGMTLEYDSDKPNESDVASAAAFGPLAEQLAGSTMSVVVDDDGRVVEANEHEEILKNLSGGGGSAPPDAMTSFASPKQFEQMSRMTSALPSDEEIAPGDEWDFDELELDGAISYSGTGSLVGYRDHKGHDVAVIVLEGGFDLDLKKLGDALPDLKEDEKAEGENDATVGAVAEVLANVQISSGKMTCTLYWDNKDNLIRWMEVTQTMVMTMPNPLDGTNTLDIPIEQVIKTSLDKKGED